MRHRCCEQMLASEEITSCLSPDVYSLVCKLGQGEEEENFDIHMIITEDGKLIWENIANYVCYLSPDGTLDYIRSMRLLRPVCEVVHLHLMSITACCFKEQYEVWFTWTNSTEVFLEVFDLLRSAEVTALNLALLKLTSHLERALGDVNLLISRECPFLLRDLLASQELAKIFGQPVMDVFRVFLGSPKSLNLRNILWHGFAAPQEIPPKYCSMLLLLTGGLGQLLTDYLQRMNLELVHRPYYNFTCLEELSIFPDVNEEFLSVAEELLMKSKFVIKIMLPYWSAAFMAFKQHRYADCVILLLPQIETGLRLVFTSVNNCQERLLTAESTTLYTTFDEMLAKQMNNGDINQLPLTLGEPILEFLWDFLNHQEGPRVRDHLSHGEVDLKVFPQCIASHLIAFAIVLLHQFCDGDFQEDAVPGRLKKCANCYRSRFHPIGRLRHQVLNCTESLIKWNCLPAIHIDQIQSSVRLKDPADIEECRSLMAEILSLTFFHMPVNLNWKNDPVSELLETKWPQVLADLCSNHIPVLYCPRSVLEVVVVLRKIITQCCLVSDQVISSAENRHAQWINKCLRSRQRQNYLRMLTSIQHLSLASRLILLLVAMEMCNVYKACEKSSSECLQHLKFLKAVLQYVENLVTYTSSEKNKWEETLELTKRILLKIRLFYGKLTT